MSAMRWFAVKTIFRHEEVAADRAIFEEKIQIYRATDASSAQVLARRDAAEYLELNEGFSQIESYGVFMLGHDDSNLDGREVWSQLMEGPADPQKFYRERYERFDLPDDATG